MNKVLVVIQKDSGDTGESETVGIYDVNSIVSITKELDGHGNKFFSNISFSNGLELKVVELPEVIYEYYKEWEYDKDPLAVTKYDINFVYTVG